jgi:hypothetical protein
MPVSNGIRDNLRPQGVVHTLIIADTPSTPGKRE